MRKTILVLMAVSLLLSSCAGSAKTACREITSDESTVVGTVYGKIQGYRDGSVYTFKGVPYARAERFMPPESPAIHEGTLMCRSYGPKAPQTSTSLAWRRGVTDYDFGFGFNLEPVDEHECLTLNVWTNGLDAKKRPVLVWIHGGGFASGSGNDLPCYDGTALAEEGDIVVVNLNHRLNVLGYADLRPLGGKYSNSVNLGMLDIIKALEWVRDNISMFGGDPSNVTIAGQSGGGGKVCTLLAMPSAVGLFHKAVAQSGSWVLHGSDEESLALGAALLDELGVTPQTADRIAGFTYEEIAHAGARAVEKTGSSKGFCPTVDGVTVGSSHFAPDAPLISKDIPMIIGSNWNEFAYDNRPLPLDAAKARLASAIGQEDAEAFVDAFSQVYPERNPADAVHIDIFLRKAAVAMADAKSAIGSKVYVYLMTWKPENNALGACHGMELPMVFRNVDRQREMTGGTESAYRMSGLMSSAWLSFIRTGDPSVKGLPEWEPYTAENGNTMIFDDECRVLHNHDRSLLEFDIPRHF